MKQIQFALFETLIIMYDAEFKGWLEPIENELDQEVLSAMF